MRILVLLGCIAALVAGGWGVLHVLDEGTCMSRGGLLVEVAPASVFRGPDGLQHWHAAVRRCVDATRDRSHPRSHV